MIVPRQASNREASGRVNQKRRTRTAIIVAAQQLTELGETPTVAQAAEAALVSRTTAYRYFPTQESLLLEVAVNIDVRELDELAQRPLENSTIEQRMLELVDSLNRHALANERLYRTGTRHYMDAWLAADRLGDSHAYTREGRRARWISHVLEPLRDVIPEDVLQRLEAALCLMAGGETIAVLRDICRLEPDQVIDVAHWAAAAILRSGIPTTTPAYHHGDRSITATHDQAR